MKTLLITALLSLTCLTLYAQNDDEVKMSITFDADHDADTIMLNNANIFIKKDDTTEENKASVKVTIENTIDRENGEVALLLFRFALDEKDLKSNNITIDKSLCEREVLATKDIVGYEFVVIDQNRKMTVVKDYIIDDTREYELQLPVYQALCKGSSKKKYTIFDSPRCIRLNLTLSTKPDQEYIDMSDKVDSLKREIENNKYCRENKKGKEKWDEDHERITKLKSDIDEIVKKHDWRQNDRRISQYAELKSQLDSIKFTEYCRSQPIHHLCTYCDLSAAQILRRLNNLYNNINQSNCKITKNTAKEIYHCASERAIENHSITTKYNQIKNFPCPDHYCSYCHYSQNQIWQELNRIYLNIQNGSMTKKAGKQRARNIHGCPNARTRFTREIIKLYDNILSM